MVTASTGGNLGVGIFSHSSPILSLGSITRAVCFLGILVLLVLGDGNGKPPTSRKERGAGNHTNVIVFLADNLGYDDVGVFQQTHRPPTTDGNKNADRKNKRKPSRTPNIDKAAMEGRRLLNWNSPAVLCSASRAALLTGKYPVRTGIYPRVFEPDAAHGLPPTETTLADHLRALGYATKIVGKWHLGQRPEYLPTQRGFDEWFGIPYHMSGGSLDGHLCTGKDPGGARDLWLPLYQGDSIVEQPVVLEDLAQRYVDESVKFLRQHTSNGKNAKTSDNESDDDDQGSRPFFLYLAFSHVHQLCAPKHSECQWASNKAGRDGYHATFGDAVEEMDWIAGRVLEALAELGAEENTLVLFTSDNGPWTAEQECSGSKGPFLGTWLAEHSDPTCTACPSEYVPSPLLPDRPHRCVFPVGSSSSSSINGNGNGGPHVYEVDGVPCGQDTGLGSAWEANVRMPAFVRWPGGGVEAGSETMETVSTLDVVPTVLGLLGEDPPCGLDGVDASSVFLGRSGGTGDRVLFFWRDGFASGPLPQPFGRFDVVAMKIGPFKLWFWTKSSHYNADPEVFHDPPLVFHVLDDPAEAFPLDPEEHSSLVEEARRLLREHKESVDKAEPLCLERDAAFLPCADKARGCRTHGGAPGGGSISSSNRLAEADTGWSREE